MDINSIMFMIFGGIGVIMAAGVIAFIVITVVKVSSGINKNASYGKVGADNTDKFYEQRAKEFLKAAEEGDADAQFALAEIYEFHESGKYLYWLEKASVQGHAEATRALAEAYDYGNESAVPPIEEDREKAIEIYTRLVEKGDADAMKKISLIYAVNYEDDEKAREWVQKAAEAGDIESMEELGNDYRLIGDIADFDKSEYWYRKAADLGSGDAMKGLGDLYCYDENRHDYIQAENWYKKAVAAKNYFAYVRLGDMVKDGKITQSDASAAYAYYTKAAEKGENQGKVKMAECLFDGYGVDRDEGKAVAILKEAANGGY